MLIRHINIIILLSSLLLILSCFGKGNSYILNDYEFHNYKVDEISKPSLSKNEEFLLFSPIVKGKYRLIEYDIKNNEIIKLNTDLDNCIQPKYSSNNDMIIYIKVDKTKKAGSVIVYYKRINFSNKLDLDQAIYLDPTFNTNNENEIILTLDKQFNFWTYPSGDEVIYYNLKNKINKKIFDLFAVRSGYCFDNSNNLYFTSVNRPDELCKINLVNEKPEIIDKIYSNPNCFDFMSNYVDFIYCNQGDFDQVKMENINKKVLIRNIKTKNELTFLNNLNIVYLTLTQKKDKILYLLNNDNNIYLINIDGTSKKIININTLKILEYFK